jgi:hypothetical protein
VKTEQRKMSLLARSTVPLHGRVMNWHPGFFEVTDSGREPNAKSV